jgi:hypothetical protein
MYCNLPAGIPQDSGYLHAVSRAARPPRRIAGSPYGSQIDSGSRSPRRAASKEGRHESSKTPVAPSVSGGGEDTRDLIAAVSSGVGRTRGIGGGGLATAACASLAGDGVWPGGDEAVVVAEEGGGGGGATAWVAAEVVVAADGDGLVASTTAGGEAAALGVPVAAACGFPAGGGVVAVCGGDVLWRAQILGIDEDGFRLDRNQGWPALAGRFAA